MSRVPALDRSFAPGGRSARGMPAGPRPGEGSDAFPFGTVGVPAGPLAEQDSKGELNVEFHRGRLIDHLHLRVADLETSKRFYGAAMQALGRALVALAPGFLVADELCLTPGDL